LFDCVRSADRYYVIDDGYEVGYLFEAEVFIRTEDFDQVFKKTIADLEFGYFGFFGQDMYAIYDLWDLFLILVKFDYQFIKIFNKI
jgi:hypothetical protein